LYRSPSAASRSNGRGRDAAAERSILTEPGTINQGQQDVGSAYGSFDRFWKLRRVGIEIVATYLAGEMEIGPGQDTGRAGFIALLIFDR